MNLFEKLFHRCKYDYEGKIATSYTYEDGVNVSIPVSFFECPICHKRKIVKAASNIYYCGDILEFCKMWERNEIDICFDDVNSIKPL